MECNPICGKCRKTSASKDDTMVKCAGICGHIFHTTCLKLTKRDFKTLLTYPTNIKWFCIDCEMALFDTNGTLEYNTLAWDTKDAPLLSRILRKMDSLTSVVDSVKTELESLKSIQNSVPLSQTQSLTTSTDDTTINIIDETVQENIVALPNNGNKYKTRSKSLNDNLCNDNIDIKLNTNAKSNQNQNVAQQVSKNKLVSPKNVNKIPHQERIELLPPATSTTDVKSGEDMSKFTESALLVATPDTYAKVLTTKSQGKTTIKEINNDKFKYIVGTGALTNVKLSAEPEKAWIHLWNAAKGTEENLILAYIKEKTPEVNVSVNKLTSKGNYASFKIGLDLKNYEIWMRAEMWPAGLRVKQFFYPRRKINTTP